MRTAFGNFDVKGKIALAAGVREFLRERVTPERAKEEVKAALDTRTERLIELVRTQIYERSSSPYLKLLKIAGCEFADFQTVVRRDGIERALERLAAEGVYLTSDEFKGKKAIVRGGESFHVTPADFQSADAAAGIDIQSSGTRNQPVISKVGFNWLAIRTFSTGVFFAAHDLFPYAHAIYDAVLPSSAVHHLLVNAKLGKATERWFARKVPELSRLHEIGHYLTTCLVVWSGKRHGPGFPVPRFIDVEDMAPIVRWIDAERRRKKACYITTIASSAARIARAASELGISLEGTKFNVAGEPFTEAKEDAIRRGGASVTSRYSYGGGMPAGLGCANPRHRDEVHLNRHMLAFIRHPAPLAGGSIHPLLCTTLYAEAPRMLLNVENGDYATLETRDCGCALQDAGLTLHLHHIRSYEKFTSEGMNYFYVDLYDLLEKVLPSEFGGGPGDYQFVEEEDENGQTRLTLVVHPAVGEVAGEKLLARLQQGLSAGPWSNQFMSRIWQDAGTLRIRREIPYASPRGKILPLHIPR
jgi:hypothetical protein